MTFANCQELNEIPEPPPELKSVPSPPEALEPEVVFFEDERSNNETQTPSAVQGMFIFLWGSLIFFMSYRKDKQLKCFQFQF